MTRQRNIIETTQFTMRIEENLCKTLKENAKKNRRSLTKEIEFELEEYNKRLNKGR